jgi:hypothetical protein
LDPARDVVIGFAAGRADLQRLKVVFEAGCPDRLSWVVEIAP